MMNRYQKYSDYMANLYGEKVYKIPIHLPVTCPNRDGLLSTGGCSFCSEAGAGFECLESTITIKDQFQRNMAYIGKKYKAQKGIAYLQNYSNTYMAPDEFRIIIEQLKELDIVGVSISTRPDCISNEHLDIIKEAQEEKAWHITMEYGLQTPNYHTLSRLNRGHGLAEFIDAVLKTNHYGFETCTHLILNLPWDTDLDAQEAAALLRVLGVKQVKIHGLYLLKNTVLGEAYERGEFQLISAQDYVERVVQFIRQSDPGLIFQRLAGRAPAAETVFCNWGMSWWKLVEAIEANLEAKNAFQGDQCRSLSSKAVKQWL